MLWDRCLAVLSVTLVYCGQTVGWIEMKLGMQVGLVPGHIVLDGHPAPPVPKGHSSPIFGPYLLWSNGWLDQDATWYGGRLGAATGHIALNGDPAPPKKGHNPPQLLDHVCCGQRAGWIKMPVGMEVGIGQDHNVLYGGPSAPPPQKKGAQPPIFGRYIVANRLDESRCHLVWR